MTEELGLSRAGLREHDDRPGLSRKIIFTQMMSLPLTIGPEQLSGDQPNHGCLEHIRAVDPASQKAAIAAMRTPTIRYEVLGEPRLQILRSLQGLTPAARRSLDLASRILDGPPGKK